MFTLIKNADIYAPRHIGRADVLISADKIVAVGPDMQISLPDLTVFDAEGKKMIPGLIDQHVHVTGGGGEMSFSSRVPEFAFSDAVRAGVTTIVGLMGTDSLTRSVENLVAKTKALNEEGLTAYCLTGAYAYPSPTITGSVGKDIAFISEVLGVKLALSDHRGPHTSDDELIRLVSDARVAGLVSGKPGIVHLHMGIEPQGLEQVLRILRSTVIPAKQFRPTHVRADLPGALEFAALGGYLDFTTGGEADAAAHLVHEYARKVPASQLTMSSDSNGSMPRWNEKREIIGITAAKISSMPEALRALVNNEGMALEDALVFQTVNVAQALNFAAKGQIATGMDADLVLLDDDMQPDTVFARGKMLMREKIMLVKGTYED